MLYAQHVREVVPGWILVSIHSLVEVNTTVTGSGCSPSSHLHLFRMGDGLSYMRVPKDSRCSIGSQPLSNVHNFVAVESASLVSFNYMPADEGRKTL